MGDRGNIVVKDKDDQVVLYTHWDGRELPEILKKALNRGRERWGDAQYLARIIFCEMLSSPDELNETTGYGITAKVWDNERPIITVCVDQQNISIERGEPYSFQEFIDIGPDKFEEFVLS